jgi:hypothetical protein
MGEHTMCVKLGRAKSSLICMGVIGSLRCRSVQMPVGPLKSGMPMLVEIPAPVNATTLAPGWETWEPCAK